MRICGSCGKRPARPKQGTCKECHAAYMRQWREGKVMVPRELIPPGTPIKASQRKAKQRLESAI